MIRTRILNLDRLNKKLKRFPADVEQEVRKAMDQTATEMVAMMRSLVPVDSGALRDSINWTWGDAPQGAMVIGEVRQSGKGEGNLRITIYAGTRNKALGDMDAYYARFVEMGTRFMRARPFFFVSYRALRRRGKSRISRAIGKAARKMAAG